MNSVTEKISDHDVLMSSIELFLKNSGGTTFLQEIRSRAKESFLNQGLPNRKNEEYKYSQSEKFFKHELTIPTQASNAYFNGISLDDFLIPNLNAHTIVLFNGSFNEEFSYIKDFPEGVIVSSLSKAFKENGILIEKYFAKYADINADPFIALNTALATDGLFVYVPENILVEKPLHIIQVISTKERSLISPRNLIVSGNNSSISIIETIHTVDLEEQVISNELTEIVIGEKAKVQYYKLQNSTVGSANAKHIHLDTTQVYQQAGSHFDTNTITLNGAWIRNNLNIVPDGENCETHLNGLFITKDDQHVDNHTLVDHRIANCESNQIYKGILDDKSTGIFNGKIFVRRDAQKTNAYQSSKNILLSDNATVNAKPQLEIYADDVKCSHGSSTGQIDPEAMFYLRSRGLGEDSAKNLLMYAFASDVVKTIHNKALKEYIDELIREKLDKNESR